MTTYVLRNGIHVDKATGEPMVTTRRDWTKEGPPLIGKDIEPYKSMVTGERIRSRSHHRQHLRDHNMVEVGNEMPKAQPRVTAVKSDKRKKVLHELFANATDKQARSKKTHRINLPERYREALASIPKEMK